MIAKRLEEIVPSDFEALLANSVPEGKTIDYKSSLPTNSDGDKKEFLADVSSFANTGGGDLIFGVEENQGVPTGLPGLTLADADMEIRRLDSIIGDGLEPRIRYAIRLFSRSSGLPLIVIRVDRSWMGPHRVIFKGHDRFYARNSAGKYPMDVSELRSAFTLAESVNERVRRFRADRIARIQANDTPIRFLPEARSKTVLHSIPLESFAGTGTIQYDVLKYYDQSVRVPPIVTGGGWDRRINLDGLATYSGSPQGVLSYTQLFRNGTIEAVEGLWLSINSSAENRIIPYVSVEKGILQYLARCFEIQKELGVNPPIVVALTLTATKGFKIAQERNSFEPGYPTIEDDLILPESIINSFEEPIGKILKPSYDLIWNACGFAGTNTLDDDGKWIYRG